MKTIAIAAALALSGLAASPVLAQPAPAAATAGISVDKTTVGEITKNPQAKAVLEKALPDIAQYYDMVGGMTLVQVAAMAPPGTLDDAKLKALQTEFDKIK